MRVLHANFAKGFRGGERQTELLVRALSDRQVRQGILLRHDSPLVEQLQGLPHLEVLTTGKPYVRKLVSARRFDLCHAHETKAAQWASANKLVRKLPYVITRRVPKVPKRDFLTRSVYTNAAVTICLSSQIRDNLLQTVPTAATQIIPDMCAELPVNETLLRSLREKYRGKYVIGNIGALVKKHKGQQILIEAMREFQNERDLHCLILGEGYDRGKLQELAQDLHNVEFLGFQTDIGTYLRLFDLFVYPSLEEGLGSTLLDAMQAGCPIVASEVGGIPEIVHNEQHGLLVPPGDAASLHAAIVRIKKSPELARRLANAGIAWADRFLPKALAATHADLYRDIIDSQPRRSAARPTPNGSL